MMKRLTIREDGTAAPNINTIGDVCAILPMLCRDFECKECPLGRLIDRLCEYEDTGLTPEEIIKLKGKKNTVAKVQQDDDIEHIKTRVTRNGIYLFGRYFWSPDLFFNCFGDQVDVLIFHRTREVIVHCRNKYIDKFYLEGYPYE